MRALTIIAAIIFLTASLPACQAAGTVPSFDEAQFYKQVQNAGSVEALQRLSDHAPIDGVYDGPLCSGLEFPNGPLTPPIFTMYPNQELQKIRTQGGWLDGWDALIWASYTDNIDVVERLIAAGANINAQDWYGNTALMLAANKGHLAIMRLLINSGARIDIGNWNGDTVLHYAVAKGSVPEVSELILSDHMDPNKANFSEQTPYMEACDGDDIPMINFFLDHGANSKQRDDRGQTGAEAIAEQERIQQIYKRLQPILAGTK